MCPRTRLLPYPVGFEHDLSLITRPNLPRLMNPPDTQLSPDGAITKNLYEETNYSLSPRMFLLGAFQNSQDRPYRSRLWKPLPTERSLPIVAYCF